MRRWLRRIALGFTGLTALALVCGVGYEQWSRAKAARAFAPTGTLIEFDGAQSHLHCVGDGSPVVVLESGLDFAGSFSWREVQREVAETTRVCAYDRAGILWSDARPEPRDGDRIADELHTLLATAGERAPYVLVGHSLGGLLIRVFDRRFDGEVAGFVLVDASHPEQMERWPAEVLDLIARQSAPPLVVTRLLAATGIARLMLESSPADELPTWEREIVEGPPGALETTSAPAIEAELEAIAEISAQAAATASLGDRPLVVLTAGRQDPIPELSAEATRAAHETHLTNQRELAELSTNADHRIIPNAGHYVQLEAPAAVVAAIRDVVIAARSAARVKRLAKTEPGKAGS